MTAKEFLSQAKYLDESINTKIESLDYLNALAGKCTSVLSDMPKSGNGNTSHLEDVVVKIIDLQREINCDIDALVDLKAEIRKVILRVENPVERLLLEKRYICCLPWSVIRNTLYFSETTAKRVHNAALESVDEILDEMEKCGP